jgi:hypothetical protein
MVRDISRPRASKRDGYDPVLDTDVSRPFTDVPTTRSTSGESTTRYRERRSGDGG